MSKTFILVLLVSLLVSALSNQNSAITVDGQTYGDNLEQQNQIEEVVGHHNQQHYELFNNAAIEQHANVRERQMPAIIHILRDDTFVSYKDVELHFRHLSSQILQMLLINYDREGELKSNRFDAGHALTQKQKWVEESQFLLSPERISAQSGLPFPAGHSMHAYSPKMAVIITNPAEVRITNGYELTIVNTDQNMNILNNIIYADNPRNGFSQNDMFHHPEINYQFSYPERRQMINPRPLATTENEDHSPVSFFMLYIKPVGAQAAGQTETGTQPKFYLCSIVYKAMICNFINYTAFDENGTYEPPFKEITNSFWHSTDSALLNTQPKRLPSVETTQPDTNRFFRPAKPDSLTKTIAPEYLAMMSQATLNDRIKCGIWTKIQR